MKIKTFIKNRYYDLLTWLTVQKMQTIDFAVWVMSVILWESIYYREEFYEYRKQNWKTVGARPNFQQFIRKRFFGG